MCQCKTQKLVLSVVRREAFGNFCSPSRSVFELDGFHSVTSSLFFELRGVALWVLLLLFCFCLVVDFIILVNIEQGSINVFGAWSASFLCSFYLKIVRFSFFIRNMY